MLKLMHAANITSAEVAIGSEPSIRRSAVKVEDYRKIPFKVMYLYKVMHNFSKITRQLPLPVKPMGEFIKLHILKITGIWIWKVSGQLGKACSCRSAGGGTGNCQSLSLVLGGARVAFQDVCCTNDKQLNCL